jgi:7,8-dihydro-6-hydroxymethylpterin-pyrophosphokinase
MVLCETFCVPHPVMTQRGFVIVFFFRRSRGKYA